MFLSVEWAKRWLPAIFLLLSLFFPWWTLAHVHSQGVFKIALIMTFPWADHVYVRILPFGGLIACEYSAGFSLIPYLCLNSALIVFAGLCGLSSRMRTRTLGGILGVLGIASYFVFVHQKTEAGKLTFFHILGGDSSIYILFLSIGLYLAIAGCLMLLFPIFRILIGRTKEVIFRSQ